MMEKEKAIFILDALASGSVPQTGEVLKGHQILKEDDVVRALQEAVLTLKLANRQKAYGPVHLEEEKIVEVMAFFLGIERNPNPHRLAQFFTGSQAVKQEELRKHPLFGNQSQYCRYAQLKDHFSTYFEDNPQIVRQYFVDEVAWKQVLYFQKKSFNHLTEQEAADIKLSIGKIPMAKREKLSPELREIRARFPRSHEPWSSVEKALLGEAISKTNDLYFLSECFQRGKNAIEICGQKLIYNDEVKVSRVNVTAA